MDKDRKLPLLQIGQFKEAFDIYDPKNVGLVPTMYNIIKSFEKIR
jgi:hypothetical protein